MNIRTDFAVLLRLEADEFTLSCREDLGCSPTTRSRRFTRTTPSLGFAGMSPSGSAPGRSCMIPTSMIPSSTDGWSISRCAGPSGCELATVSGPRDLGHCGSRQSGSREIRRVGPTLPASGRPWGVVPFQTFEESHGRVQVGRIIVSPPWQFPDPDDTTIILRDQPIVWDLVPAHHPSTRLALFSPTTG